LIQGFLRAHVQEYEARTEGFPIEPGQGSSEGADEAGRRTKLSRATELIARLKSRGKLNQVIYNALLNALFSTREFESGLEVFKLMKLELDAPKNAHPHRPGIELYGNGLVDSYGIIFRRLIQFGQLELFHSVYTQFYRNENFAFVPLWIEKLIDRFENSRS
jgi:pentatricopeptide repeat protein